MGAFLASEPDKADVQRHMAKMQWYRQTLEAIETHEREAWAKLTPGTARLMLYWIQMLLCAFESLPRILFHAVAWLHAATWLMLALVLRRLRSVVVCGKTEDRMVQHGTAKPLLAETQLQHQQWRLRVYAQLCPRLLWYNLKNPWEPFFADGNEVSIHRPEKPFLRGFDKSGSGSDCCDPLCDCECSCFEHVLELEIKYFRSNFFLLSGYHSCQCGSCLGPCVKPCCYSPCVGGDVESGYCKACEPEDIRLARWHSEAVEAKRKRTVEFFTKRPDLMRPSKMLMGDALDKLPPPEGPMVVLLESPQQQAITPMVC